MTSILVVCTGNICRSPIAEGLLREALRVRFGDEAPAVSSAGTAGLEGRPATPEAVEAARERGTDISGHVAREVTEPMVGDADVVVTMTREQREELRAIAPAVAVFTLKELVRVLESLPPGANDAATTPERREAGARARAAGFVGNPADEDVADPLGLPLESYRAIAWEIDEWTDRLVDGLYGADSAPDVQPNVQPNVQEA